MGQISFADLGEWCLPLRLIVILLVLPSLVVNLHSENGIYLR